MTLPLNLLKRLASIMARATGSTFDAERLTALSLADALLRQHGLSWEDVLHAEPPTAITVPVDRTWKQAAEQVLYDHSQALNDWETDFIRNILLRQRAPTPKVDAKLRQLCLKVGVPAWTAVP